jgi:hypothetical protein
VAGIGGRTFGSRYQQYIPNCVPSKVSIKRESPSNVAGLLRMIHVLMPAQSAVAESEFAPPVLRSVYTIVFRAIMAPP